MLESRRFLSKRQGASLTTRTELQRRIAFLDVEGTLLKRAVHLDNRKVAPSAWTLLAEELGADALREEEESKDRWLAGGYAGYIEWMQDTIRIHQKYGLHSQLFQRVLDAVEVMPGADITMNSLKERGFVTVMISGGFKRLVDRLQLRWKVDHALAGCEYFFDEDGSLTHWNLMPADYDGKVEFMRSVIREYGSIADICVFVGDGPNDVELARAVGTSVAFNGHTNLVAVTTHAVAQAEGDEDLSAVLPYLLHE